MLLVVKLPQAGGCAATAWRKSLRARPPIQAPGARHFLVMCYIQKGGLPPVGAPPPCAEARERG